MSMGNSALPLAAKQNSFAPKDFKFFYNYDGEYDLSMRGGCVIMKAIGNDGACAGTIDCETDLGYGLGALDLTSGSYTRDGDRPERRRSTAVRR